MDRFSLIPCLLVLIQLAAAAELKPFPSFVTPCKNDANLGECFRKNVQGFQGLLESGSEEFNVPSIEPFYLENFIVSQKSSSGLHISASNVRIYNASKYEYSNMRCEFAKHCKFDIDFVNLSVTGTYHIDGMIVALPIKGTGPMVASFNNVKARDGIIYFGQRLKDGVAYGKVTKVNAPLFFNGGYLKLDNLFNGDKTLGDAVNDAINANIDVLENDLKPVVEKALNREFRKAADGIVGQYTIEQLFPVN